VLKLLDVEAFAFDFAASATNAKAADYWSVDDNSLMQSPKDWALACVGGWGWLNPPFSNIGAWSLRCREAMLCGARIAFLVPASVGSNWYRDSINGHMGVRVLFLNGRPSFDGVAPFPKDCMLVLFNGAQRNRIFSTEVWQWREKESR
jgi:hypothetical protein